MASLDDAKGSAGTGPYRVETSEDDGFHYVWGPEGRGRGYPLRKTALRAARQFNDAALGPFPVPGEAEIAARTADGTIKLPTKEALEAVGVFLEEEPGIVVGLDLSGSKKDVAKRYPDKPKAAPLEPVKAEPVVVSPYKGTREQWLNAFVTAARKVFKQRELELGDNIRVSVGFMFRSPKAIGQCWHADASADGTREIFINPTLDDSSRVADVLTHELCHTLFGPDEKHGKNFKAAVTKLGLEGKATATIAGEAWHAWADPILTKLGPIPHAALDPKLSGQKKQTTRLIKAECGLCGFTFRSTAKWLNDKTLRCPDYRCEGDVEVAGEEGE